MNWGVEGLSLAELDCRIEAENFDEKVDPVTIGIRACLLRDSYNPSLSTI